MYGEVDKIKLGTTIFPNWRRILSQTNNNNITVKKSPWYCGRDHSSSAFVY